MPAYNDFGDFDTIKFVILMGLWKKIAKLWLISSRAFYDFHIDGYRSYKTVSGIFCLWYTDPMAILFLWEVKLTYIFNLQAPTDCLLRILMEIADTVLEVIIL